MKQLNRMHRSYITDGITTPVTLLHVLKTAVFEGEEFSLIKKEAKTKSLLDKIHPIAVRVEFEFMNKIFNETFR